MKTDYIVLNKNKIEERIKELKEEYSKLTDKHCVGQHYAVIENINFLTELVGASIDAETVFNAARECSEEYNGGGEYNILSYCGDEPVAKYTNWEEYTKTLNI